MGFCTRRCLKCSATTENATKFHFASWKSKVSYYTFLSSVTQRRENVNNNFRFFLIYITNFGYCITRVVKLPASGMDSYSEIRILSYQLTWIIYYPWAWGLTLILSGPNWLHELHSKAELRLDIIAAGAATVPVPNNTNPEVYNLWTEDLSILFLWWNWMMWHFRKWQKLGMPLPP